MLGWRNFEKLEPSRPGAKWLGPNSQWYERPPKWTGDDSAAFRLMIEHECYPCLSHDAAFVIVAYRIGIIERRVRTALADHPDKAAAIRYTIAHAVVRKSE